MRKIAIEDFNKLYQTDPEVKEWVDATINAYLRIKEESINECLKQYPQYESQIKQCLDCLMDCLFFGIKGLRKLMKWFERISDYIEEIDFFELKDPNFRHPIALETWTWDYVLEEFSGMEKKDPSIKDKFIRDLQQQPFYDNNPLASLLEASMAGIWVSSNDLSNVLNVPVESLENEAEHLIKKGVLREKDVFQTSLDDFNEN